MEVDSRFVLGELNFGDIGEFPQYNKKAKEVVEDSYGRAMLEKLREDYKNIDDEILEKIYDIYEWDMEMFGYDRM